MFKKKGFTLLEIIIVIIIVAALAAIAMLRFFTMIEFSKSTEAMQMIEKIREAIENCYMGTIDYGDCTDIDQIGIDNPSNIPNSHFTYSAITVASHFAIIATRNAHDGGTPGDTIRFEYAPGGVIRTGTGVFKGIN